MVGGGMVGSCRWFVGCWQWEAVLRVSAVANQGQVLALPHPQPPRPLRSRLSAEGCSAADAGAGAGSQGASSAEELGGQLLSLYETHQRLESLAAEGAKRAKGKAGGTQVGGGGPVPSGSIRNHSLALASPAMAAPC